VNFDCNIDRRKTHSLKWDMMESIYGVPEQDGLPMWVADMDFQAPGCIRTALQKMVDHGVFGYYGDDESYRDAICWWMAERHGWEVDSAAIFTTHGLVNGTALCIEAFTRPGDEVVLFTPVYHAFARVIRASGRRVKECPLLMRDGRYEMDFDACDALMTGNEKMVILCSPHNPGGRVWRHEELRAMAGFALRHDLVLVSDEIHHDLVMPDYRHIPMAVAAPDVSDRLIMLTAPSKTFNIAGGHSGNVIIHDPALRKRFSDTMARFGISANSFGLAMTEAAYSPEGARWVDQLVCYLDRNRRLFDEGINAIPGLRSMPLEATYLAWVDFSGTGMGQDEILRRVEQGAKIASNHGESFGKGGESFLRFNLATPRARVEDAVARMRSAFADLQ